MTATGPITAGADNALWFADGKNTIGRITAHGVVTTTTIPDAFYTGSVRAMTTGPDGAIWFTNAAVDAIGQISTADSVTATPDQGPVSTPLNIFGAGFTPGETVNVTYGTSFQASSADPLCSATAASDGTFTCTGTVPPGGQMGIHPITAKGTTSGIHATSLYLLT